MSELNTSDEQTFLVRLKSGDEQAFSELVTAYSPRMYAVAKRLLRNDHDVCECLQEAFLQTFKNCSRFEGKSSFSTWLHRVVVNAALMRLRSRKCRPEALLDDLPPQFNPRGKRIADEQPGALPSAQESLERAETRDWVQQTIALLPEEYRTVLILRDIEEFDTNETARQLEISPGAVKTRLHRARTVLKHRLEMSMKKGS